MENAERTEEKENNNDEIEKLTRRKEIGKLSRKTLTL